MKTVFKPSYLLVAMLTTLTLSACQSTPEQFAAPTTPSVILQDAQILEILPHRTACQSTTPMQCLLVKIEGQSDADIFYVSYNAIKGFEPVVGTRYKIKASMELNQSTGQPTGFWQLTEILSQRSAR